MLSGLTYQVRGLAGVAASSRAPAKMVRAVSARMLLIPPSPAPILFYQAEGLLARLSCSECSSNGHENCRIGQFVFILPVDGHVLPYGQGDAEARSEIGIAFLFYVGAEGENVFTVIPPCLARLSGISTKGPADRGLA